MDCPGHGEGRQGNFPDLRTAKAKRPGKLGHILEQALLSLCSENHMETGEGPLWCILSAGRSAVLEGTAGAGLEV